MIEFYGYKKCSTCRKAEKTLESKGVEYKFIDITETPPSKAKLKKVLQQGELEIRKLFNTSGEQYKALGMKDKVAGLTEAQALELLAGNGRLVKRPMVMDGAQSTVGFDPVTFVKTWKS
jgi:arsenate reductase